MFLYDSVAKTDFLLKKFHGLEEFKNINLYIEDNFKKLNDLIGDFMNKQLLVDEYNQNVSKVKEIKARNIQLSKKQNKDKDEKIKKTPLYFFKKYPLEANY